MSLSAPSWYFLINQEFQSSPFTGPSTFLVMWLYLLAYFLHQLQVRKWCETLCRSIWAYYLSTFSLPTYNSFPVCFSVISLKTCLNICNRVINFLVTGNGIAVKLQIFLMCAAINCTNGFLSYTAEIKHNESLLTQRPETQSKRQEHSHLLYSLVKDTNTQHTEHWTNPKEFPDPLPPSLFNRLENRSTAPSQHLS